MKSRPTFTSIRSRPDGFSLIEIVLAIGIISFALVGILGLFPVALDAAAKSQRETQAALIARTIYTDIDSRADTKRLLITTTNSARSTTVPDTDTIDLKASTNYYLAYDSEGLPMGKMGADDYDSGKLDAVYMASIKVTPLALPAGMATTNSTNAPEYLARVDVSVETPASANKKLRSKYPFVSVFRQGTVNPTNPATP